MADSTATATSPYEPPPAYSKKATIDIVITGKSGAGKSTLMSNLFEIEDIKGSLSANPGTLNCSTKHKKKNEVNFILTDTVGLSAGGQGGGEGRKEKLKKMSEHIKLEHRKTDLLLFCIAVSPSSRFDNGNPAIMKSMQDAFGKDIWKQCVLVLTFSNTAWDGLAKKRSREEAVELYKAHLEEYATDFEKELNRLNVHDVTVKTPFTEPAQPAAGQTTIMAIPAGGDVDDVVFPEGEDANYPWNDVFITKLIQCSNDCKLTENLLQYRYGRERALAALAILGKGVGGLLGAVYGGAVGGIAGGVVGGAAVGVGWAALGIGIGAIMGALGGPVGAGAGAVIGEVVASALAGGIVLGGGGAAVGGVGAAVVGVGVGATEGAKEGAKAGEELMGPKPDID